MTLPREITTAGMSRQYEAFGELIAPLAREQWERPTRCAGWRVADVAAHVVGQLTDVVNGRFDGLGTPEVTRRQVEQRRGRTPAELAEELLASAKLGADIVVGLDDTAWAAAAPGGLAGTLGFGVEALWYDTFVHADDVRAALGAPSVADDGLLASVSHLSQLLTDAGWGPAVLALDGLGRFPVSGGGGRVVGGDPMQFVLAATGRGDPGRLGLDESLNVYRN